MGSFRSAFSQLITSLYKTPLICKCCYGILLIGFSLCAIDVWTLKAMTILPFNLLRFPPWLWTFATFWAFELNVILLINHIVCLHIAFTVLETMWGLKELIKYFVIVNLVTALVSVCVLASVYLLTGYYEMVYFFDPHYPYTVRGLTGFDGAVLVSLKQAMPDTVIFNSPLGRYKNNHLPLTWMLVAFVLTLCDVLNPICLCMFATGAYSSWCYLRFYQIHKNDTQGDMTDSFSFASFFPSFCQGPIVVLSGVMYKIALRLKICKPTIRRFDVRQLQSVTVTLPGMEGSDAERRKQKALRDLNERLAKAKEQQLPAWDDESGATDNAEYSRHPLTHQVSSLAPTPPPIGDVPASVKTDDSVQR